MKKQITIIAEHDESEVGEQRTHSWLAAHGIKVDEYMGLQVLTINNGEMDRGQYTGVYVVGFDNAEGDAEVSHLVISLEPDPYDTSIRIEYEGDYACACKGHGCATCNEELAALERGENPYAHHVAPRP